MVSKTKAGFILVSAYQDLFTLKNKVAVVTGAASILGSEFCKALCTVGAKVACLDSDNEKLRALQDLLAQQIDPERFMFAVCDLSNPESVQKSTESVLANFSNFIGNVVEAYAVGIMGNKKFIEKIFLMKHIAHLLR